MDLKPTTKAILEYITYDQRVTLCDWLLNRRMTYAEVVVQLKEQFDVQCSIFAVQEFYRKYVYQELIRRRAESVREAGMRTEEIAKNPGDFIKPTMDALWEKAFLESRKPESSVKEMKIYVELLVRLKAQLLDERKVELMERRMVQLERKTAALEKEANKKPRLTDQEFMEKMRTVLKGEKLPSTPVLTPARHNGNGFTS